MKMSLLIKAITIFTTATLALGASPASRQAKSQDEKSEKVFISGGSSGIGKLKTNWPDRRICWLVQSQAGKVVAGKVLSDSEGIVSIGFPVPDVRSAVQLVVVLNPTDTGPENTKLIEAVVLPKDPYLNVRKTLDELEIVLFPSIKLEGAFKQSGLSYIELQYETAMSEPGADVVILDGLLENDLELTQECIKNLSQGTCIIVFDNEAGQDVLSLTGYLSRQKPEDDYQSYSSSSSPVFTDFEPEWLGSDCPSYRLSEPKRLVSLQILAGKYFDDGTIYPIVIEHEDINGRRWLVWSLPKQFTQASDPRYNLLLRNSLLWAYEFTTKEKTSQWK